MLLTMAIEDYLLACSALSKKTARWYDQKLRMFARWAQTQRVTQLEQLEARHLRAFQEWLLSKRVCDISPAFPWNTELVSPFTVRGYVQVAKGFTTWALVEGYLQTDPFKLVKKPKEPETVIETFSPEDIHKLLDATRAQSPQALRDRALLLFLLDTGLRATEVVSLKLDHLHLKEDSPWVKVDWHTSKGRKAREVGLGPETARALTRYLRLARFTHSASNDYVWVNRYGQRLTDSGLRQAIEELNKRAGVQGKRVSPHTFRHTFARTFIEGGGDIFTLSRLLGHASVAVTERYLRAFRSRTARTLQARRPSIVERLLRPE